MKKLIFVSLLPIVASVAVSSCHTETVVCDPGTLNVNGVGFDLARIASGRVFIYVANTNTLIDSARIPAETVGNDTVLLFRAQSGYDYRFSMTDSTTYFFNNITLAGTKTQDFKRGPLTGKMIGCIDRVVSCDINGAHQNLSGNKYSEIYVRP